MGMTIWIHILNGRKIEGNQNDCSWMHRLSEPLDALCAQHGVEKLSAFFDYTDLEHNMDDDIDDSDEEPKLNPETGWEWGIEDMEWFPTDLGLRTLSALHAAVSSQKSIGDLPAARKGELLAELQDCIRQLTLAVKHNQTFHFTVLM